MHELYTVLAEYYDTIYRRRVQEHGSTSTM